MIFLDAASTTKPKFFAKDYNQFWLNSNTPYAYLEKRGLEEAKETIKKCLEVKGGYILFTRCASESIEWLCNHFCIDEYWCSPYEHDSVFDACDGNVLVEEKYRKFDLQDCAIYCHQLVNQITGTVWDIKSEHDKVIENDNQFFAVDLTAAIGKITLPNDLETYCDALFFSGHKIHTEKGIGCLWISDRMFKFLNGKESPNNQHSLLHGTTNVAGALAMSEATAWATNSLNLNNRIEKYKALFLDLLYALNDAGVECKSVLTDNKSYAINLLTLPNINADALQQFLGTKNIYIGIAGSACSESHNWRVPEAFGLTEKECEQSIRISFDEDTSSEDINEFVLGVQEFKRKFL